MDEPKTKKTNELIELLRKSHGILSHEQFIAKLESNQFQIIQLPSSCYALIEWIQTEKGSTLWIHTCVGNVEDSEKALRAIETYARNNDAKVIAGIGRWGWKSLLKRLEFETRTKLIFFEKDLL